MKDALASRRNAFRYLCDDLEHGVVGLRNPQIGALHSLRRILSYAVAASWSPVSGSFGRNGQQVAKFEIPSSPQPVN